MSEQILPSTVAASEMTATLDEVESGALPETSAVEDIPAAPGVGQQLRAAREEKNMSAADVAKLLKLSAHQVVALEEDDWSRLPVTVIRGFVRNYARLLKLDPEPLMQALTALQMPPPPKLDLPAGTNTTLPEMGKVERRDYAAVLSGLALVVLAVLAYFFVPQDFWQAKIMELTTSGKPSVVSEKSEPAPVEASPAQMPSQPANAPVAPAAAVSQEPAVQSQPIQQAVPSAPGSPAGSLPSSGLKLSFAQPSWVEIRDRSGQIIFSQLNPAGSQRDIEGQPPFALVIGNATNVTVQYKGKVVELSQRSKDDVARLNLD
jgi:cytoskeleton protein RodZ